MKRFLYIGIVVIMVIGGLIYYFTRPNYSNYHLPKKVQTNIPFLITIAGDSLAAGQGASDESHGLGPQILEQIKTIYPKATLTNLGVSGALVPDVTNIQIPEITKDPQLIVVVVGTNDLTHSTNIDQFQKNYTELVQKLASFKTPVILFNVPKFSNTPVIADALKQYMDLQTNKANDAIKTAVKGNSNFSIFDFYSLTANNLGANSNLLSSDSFHPNNAGYQLIAQKFFESIK